MDVTVRLVSIDSQGAEVIRVTLIKNDVPETAQEKVFHDITKGASVLGLGWLLCGDGLIKLIVDVAQLTDAVIQAVTQAVDKAFASI
jgi:hypothetical protein